MNLRNRSVVSISLVTVLIAGVVIGSGTPAGADTAPNGQIAYSSWDDELNYDIYRFDPATPSEPPVRLTTDGQYNQNPDWSPDGTMIVYDGWADFGGPRIQVMDADPATEDWTVLSDPCADDLSCYGDFQPEWSPNGTRIAFVSSRPNADGTENWSYELYVMDATGEVGSLPRATRLTTDPLPEFGGGIEDSQITWSPDGERIAFLSEGRGLDPDTCDLWVMDSADRDGDGFGDNMEQITFDESSNCDPFEDVSPQWSPNSSLIAFTSVRSGYFDIWIVNADNPSDLRNVTQTPTDYEDQPSWSPDGTQVIFRSSVSGDYELYSLPVPPPEPPGPANSLRAAAVPTPTQLTFDGSNKQHGDWGALAGSRPGTVTLAVFKNGRGKVKTVSGRIACGRRCIATYVEGARVTLKATPRRGYRFGRWQNACADEGRQCTLRMNRSKSLTARFVKKNK